MSRNDKGNIVICGIGGQGIILFGKILGEFFLRKGYEIKVSDIVGLGQRGGSVLCHFRYSNQPIMSPLIKAGDADCIVSFEQTETLRNAHYLKDTGVIFTSNFEMSCTTVNAEIQKDIQGDKTQIIKDIGKKSFIIDLSEYNDTIHKLSQMTNIAMLGFFAGFMGFNHDEVIQVMKENINSRFIEGNLKVYEIGKMAFEKQKAFLE